MGGETTEMSASTTEVVIEAAHFDPVTIARAARRHRLPSEASKRFERGIDPTLGPVAARRVADLLVEHGGGTIVEPSAPSSARPRRASRSPIDAGLPARIAGFAIAGRPGRRRAARPSAARCRATATGVTATPPPWRTDITDPYDLVEEVVRIVGYDQVPSVLPAAPAGRGLTTRQRLRRRVGIALAAAGLCRDAELPVRRRRATGTRSACPPTTRAATALRIANPLSEEEPLLRTTLLPGLLETLGPQRRPRPDRHRAVRARQRLPAVG